jgi:hypothetical protein
MNTVVDRNELNGRVIYDRKLCWASIFGGVVVAITLGLLLNLLGTALGFAAFQPDMESTQTVMTSTLIWIFIAGVIAMFIAGWVSSNLGGLTDLTKGYWQGFIVAGITTLFMLFVATSALGSMIGGTFNIISKVISTAGSAASSTVSTTTNAMSNISSTSKNDLMAKAKDILPSSLAPMIDQLSYEADAFSESVNNTIDNQTPSPADVEAKAKSAKEKAEFYKSKVSPALANFLQSINTDNYEQSKKDLISALSEASGKPASEVEAQVAAWQKSFEDAKAKAIQLAKETAKKSAEVLSHFAFMYFFVILASVVAAGIGGMLGAKSVKRY